MAGELQVISDCYGLVHYLSQRIEKFPRHHRYSLGLEIERRLQAVLALLIRAKYAGASADRRRHLAEANVELELLRFQVRLAHELRALPTGSHGHTIERLRIVGAQVGGWLKATGVGP